jgi:hypothetical protein
LTVRYDGIVLGECAVDLLAERIVLALQGTAAIRVFRVFRCSIFLPAKRPAPQAPAA